MQKQFKLVPALALAAPLAVLAASAALPTRGQEIAIEEAAMARALPPHGASEAVAQARRMNSDTATPFIGEGATGPAVLRAQVLLDRHWFSPGEIDGRYGRNTRHAILNFQHSRGLPATGTMDQRTWRELEQGAGDAFTTYELTEDDVNGPYEKIPRDPHAMARMERLSYESLTEALAERFHASPELLQTLNRGRPFEVGRTLVVPRVTDEVALPGGDKHIVISKSQRILYLVGESGELLAAFPISIGGSGVEIPVGEELKINSDVENPDFRYDADLLKGYDDPEPAVVPPGPNSPVGLVWMGLSKPHWGIHGTSEPSQMARVQTNGCIRMTNWDVLRLTQQVGIGTLVRTVA